jgi:hypothetical protein
VTTKQIYSSLVVDKVVARYCFGNDPKAQDTYKALHAFHYSVLSGDFPIKGKVWKSAKGAHTNISQPLPSGAELHIKFGFAQLRHWAWYSFNPSRMSAEDWMHVYAMFEVLLPDGFKTLWDQARLSRYDIALDFDGVDFKDYCFIDNRLSAGNAIYQELGTTYLGSEKSARSMICYDKAKQLNSANQGPCLGDRLRLEARIQNPKALALKQIADIPNPFSKLAVIDKNQLACSTDPLLQALHKRLVQGLPADVAYFEHDKAQRKALWSALKSISPAWWNAESAWLAYPAAAAWPQQLEQS